MNEYRQKLDELVDEDPIQLRDEAYKLLDRAEEAEGELARLNNKRIDL